jgi:eukaryotic-like serine/threonine-protein kinase
LVPKPTPAASPPGDVLAGTRYRTVGTVGRGGMGEVVLAEHIGLGKRVAVKLLHEELARDPAVVRRMQIEARTLAALESPHIVQVTDFGQTATGRTYIVMERLVGRTLGAEVRVRGALPVAEALGYVGEVLAGLHAAHAMGIVHRDIKPDNVFLCDAVQGSPRRVKILDFGVAKVLDIAGGAALPAIPRLVTEEGTLVGTPRIVAPEQAQGRAVDARTDVYAVGLLLYTLIVGEGPFAHLKDAVDLMKANAFERPAPPSTRTSQPIPPALDAAVLRALEKRPDDRFQSADELAVELRRIAATLPGAAVDGYADTEPSRARPPGSERPHARPQEPEDRTVRLAGAALVTPAAGADPAGEGTPPAESARRARGRNPGVLSETAAEPEAPAPRVAWGGFVISMLVTAALCALALATVYRMMGP